MSLFVVVVAAAAACLSYFVVVAAVVVVVLFLFLSCFAFTFPCQRHLLLSVHFRQKLISPQKKYTKCQI